MDKKTETLEEYQERIAQHFTQRTIDNLVNQLREARDEIERLKKEIQGYKELLNLPEESEGYAIERNMYKLFTFYPDDENKKGLK